MWGKPERVRVLNMEQLHAHDPYQNVNEHKTSGQTCTTQKLVSRARLARETTQKLGLAGRVYTEVGVTIYWTGLQLR